MSQKSNSEENNSNLVDGEAIEQSINNSLNEDNESLTYNEEEELISKNSNESLAEKSLKQEEKAESSSENSSINNKNIKNSNKEDQEKNLIEIENLDSEAEVEKEYELLFCVQGIGKETSNKSYEKHQFCEPSLRDIHRFLRNDDSENPQMKYLILNWKTAETDIIPLMLNYENSEKIQQLGLVLLTDLTEPLSELVEKRPVFERLLTDLQEFIVKSQLVELLSNTLADATAKHREASIMRNDLKLLENELSLVNRKANNKDLNGLNDDDNVSNFDGNVNKAKEDILSEEEKIKKNQIKKKIAEIESKAEQLIELVFVFFKQLLSIYFSNSIEKNIENSLCFIRKFSKCKIFDAIIYHSQSYTSEFSKRIAPILLELNYLLLRPFEPLKIFEYCRSNRISYEGFKNENTNKSFKSMYYEEAKKSELAILRENERKEKVLRFNQQSHRPNNFGTTLKITRPLDNSTIVITNFNQFIQNPDKVINEKMNTLANQRKKPIRKLIKKVKMNALKISEEIKLINDFKICENLTLDFSHADIIFPIKNFCEEFLKYCFNNIVKYFISEIISLSDAFEKYDFYNLINLIGFFLNFERLRLHDAIGNEKNKDAHSGLKIDKKKYNQMYDLKNVLEGISPAVMDFIYNIFFNESIKGPKDNRKLYEFYASSRFIQYLLLICLDLHKFKTDQNLDLSVLIQDYILTRDFRKPIKAMFILYNENHYPQAILFNCIQLTDIYFTCLEYISQKRKLKIKTKKKLKARKDSEDEEKLIAKLKKEEKDNNFIIKQENSESESEKEKSVDSDEEKFEIIERDLNLLSEIEQLLDYSIISKIMRLFNFNLMSNKNFSSENIKEIENLKKENISKYIYNIFNRMVNKTNASWIFYQVEYLSIIHEIMNNKLFTTDAYFANLKTIFSLITKNFFELFNSKNKLVMIESLFRFTGPMHKNQILSNYEYTDIAEDFDQTNATNKLTTENHDNNNINNNKENNSDEEADAVYDGKILFERDLEDNQVKKPKKKKEEDYLENLELIKWTENEDLILIDNYLEFKDQEGYLDILDKLFPLKTFKDIKNRIKTLKLKKGYEKAMKVMTKIHQKKKEKEENLFNVIIELSDECRNEVKKHKIEKTITAIKEQLKSYKLKKDLLNESPEIDCVLIPTSNDEIDIFKDRKFMEFIKNIGFVPPSDLEAEKNFERKNNNEIIDLTKNVEKENHENDNMDIVENSVTKNYENDDNNNNNKEADLMDIVEDNEKIESQNKEKTNNKIDLNKFWKINPLSDATDIEIMIEKLHNFEKVINENMQVNEEYEEIKRRNKKDKKEKKKKHKKEKKKKHKKDKKNKKHKSKQKNDQSDNSENENNAEVEDNASSRSVSENNEDANEEHYNKDIFQNIFENDKINVIQISENEKSDYDREKNIKNKSKKNKINKFSKHNFYANEGKDNYKQVNDEELIDIEDNDQAKDNDLDELEFLNNNLSKNKKRLKKGFKDNNFLSEFE